MKQLNSENVPHNKKSRVRGDRRSRPSRVDPADRPFIAWDGEGQNLRGDGPQSYVLFGCSTGDRIKSSEHLDTLELVKFILDVGRKHPHAYHVGFAFNYDVNMIVQGLAEDQIRHLYEKQFVNLYDKTDPSNPRKYCIRITRSKWISVSEHHAKWSPRRGKNGKRLQANYCAKDTVKIYDFFSFFNCSFVKAARDMLGDSEELRLVEEGKKHRGGSQHCPECNGKCLFDTDEYMVTYWEHEIKLLAQVAEVLRKRFYDAGMKITKWYGPGALASYSMKQHGIKQHMNDPGMDIKRASQFGYAGGRFELYKIGRVQGPIYSYDFNSAYPHGISKVPSLSNGTWRPTKNPNTKHHFSIHNIRFKRDGILAHNPSPLFYRDKHHAISYPWTVEGWYWYPEYRNVMGSPYTEYLGGYEFIPANDDRPFDWVREMYALRREWKQAGNPNQLALKLTMNSIYGKMAQRVGWTEEKSEIPPWHQLEWAGWVTSYTRGRMWDTIRRVPFDKLIAVETDGFYSTMTPTELGIVESDELGAWGIDVYDEAIYFQSGLAWMRQGDKWTPKRRGLDADTFTLEDAIAYCKTLGPVTDKESAWKPFVGKQTRFIGMGAALASGDFKAQHCRWVTSDKEILPGAVGKRIHVPRRCRACSLGYSAWDMAHDLVITIDPTLEYRSQAHYIPWLGKDQGDTEPSWFEARELDNELISI